MRDKTLHIANLWLQIVALGIAFGPLTISASDQTANWIQNHESSGRTEFCPNPLGLRRQASCDSTIDFNNDGARSLFWFPIPPVIGSSEQTVTFRTFPNRWSWEGTTSHDGTQTNRYNVSENFPLHVRSAALLATQYIMSDLPTRFCLTNECAVCRLPDAAWRIA